MTGGMTKDDDADNDDAAAVANSDGTRSIITAGGGDDKGDDDNARPMTGPRRTPGAAALLPAVSGADREQGGAATSSAITAVSSVISSTAKNILREFFERVDWPLNKGLPRGAEFFSGPLGDIVKRHGLLRMQKRIRRWRIQSVRHFGRMQQRMYLNSQKKNSYNYFI